MKILYITTVGSTMCFFTGLTEKLLDMGAEVEIAANTENRKPDQCYYDWGCRIHEISCTRKVFSRNNLKAIRQIKRIVREGKYDVVHCHTPVAAFCARLACAGLRKRGVKVIYTAHGFHFYKGAPLRNWLVFYPLEWLCSFWTDTIITINREDCERAKKRLHAQNIEYIPGVGVDTDKFKNASVDRNGMRNQLGIPENAFLLLSVGELNSNKNQQTVIRALAEISDEHIHYAIVGRGDEREHLEELAKSLGVSDRVHFIGFRRDVEMLYKIADADVFPSVREGLGLAAIEGMAAGLPLICADNRGTREYAENGKNAIVCACNSKEDFKNAIVCLANNPQMCRELGENAAKTSQAFDIRIVIEKMLEIYKAQQTAAF